MLLSLDVGLDVIGYLRQGLDVRPYDVEERGPCVDHLRLESVDPINLHPGGGVC